MPTKAQLEEQLAEARRALYGVQTDFELFKERVVEKAVEVAAEQSWCDDGLRETLSALGLELPVATYSGEMTIKVHFKGVTSSPEPDDGWIAESLRLNATDLSFDDDWQSSEFTIDSVDVDFFDKE